MKQRWMSKAIMVGLLLAPASVSSQDGAGATTGISVGRGAAIPEVYTVRPGDTLWDISAFFYGNPYEWPRVWSYNPEITNPHWIYPDDRVRLRAAGAPESTSAARISVRSVASTSGTVYLRNEAFLDEDALERRGTIVGSPSERAFLVEPDMVYVNFDEEEHHPSPGDVYTIYRPVDEDDRGSGEDGELVRILGTVRIVSWDEEDGAARARIIESVDVVERGFHIAPITTEYELHAPVAATADVQGEVIASVTGHSHHVETSVIFIDVGTEDGVREGNRAFVVRRHDPVRHGDITVGLERGVPDYREVDEPERYPVEVVGEGIVVHTSEHNAAVYLRGAIDGVVVGDRVEFRTGY